MKRKGWTFRWLTMRILLVAVAFQGITPSAHNLASSKLLRMLFWTATHAESNAERGEAGAAARGVAHDEVRPGGAPPPIEAQRKKTPGVICLPVRTGSPAGVRRHAGHLRFIVFAPHRPSPSLIPSAETSRPCIFTLRAPRADVLHTLCRLTC